MIRATLVALAGLMVSVHSVGADGLSDLTPGEEYRESVAAVRPVLAAYRTRNEMTLFVGAEPAACQSVSEKSEICVWRLSDRQSGWRPLSLALDTGDRLNLICEFPVEGGSRGDDSCSVHAQRSNRGYYGSLLDDDEGEDGGIAGRAAARAAAQKLLDDATTAFELSTLMGDAATDCHRASSQIMCIWRTTRSTYGQGTLAMIADTSFRYKMRLTCQLPLEGGRRASDSCAVQVDR